MLGLNRLFFKYGNPDLLLASTSNPYGKAVGVPLFGFLLLKK